MQLTQFSPWDYNWPYGPPPDAVPPRTDPDELNDDKQDEQNKACGSVIGIENQTLGESIPVAGTPFSLVYQSDRVSGRTAERTLTIPLTPATLPTGLRRVELTISLAGRQFFSTFLPTANLSTQFVWDGRDAYGRNLQGNQRVSVNIGYVYEPSSQVPVSAQGFTLLPDIHSTPRYSDVGEDCAAATADEPSAVRRNVRGCCAAFLSPAQVCGVRPAS